VQVKATREGIVGGLTASGYRVDLVVPFVALPSAHALFRFVKVRNPKNNRQAFAVVLDVGPWNTHDDDYVLGKSRPQAETGKDQIGRPTNHAGIDLSERVWFDLGMTDNGPVEWEFL
jgi:hypothetical protein